MRKEAKNRCHAWSISVAAVAVVHAVITTAFQYGRKISGLQRKRKKKKPYLLSTKIIIIPHENYPVSRSPSIK